MTHQYIPSSSFLRSVIVTVKTPASLSSAMKLLLLPRFLGVFTTILHNSYVFPLHQYFVCSLNWRSYWQETVTDPPYAPVTLSGAESWTESTACFVIQRRQKTGAAKYKKKLIILSKLLCQYTVKVYLKSCFYHKGIQAIPSWSDWEEQLEGTRGSSYLSDVLRLCKQIRSIRFRNLYFTCT